MTYDMMKDMILHTIGQWVVRPGRTGSPLGADWESGWGGLENSLKKVSLLHRPTKLSSPTHEVNFPVTCTYLTRITLLLLLMILGVGSTWGAVPEGYYYFANNAAKADGANYTYNSSNPSNSFYLCPAIGSYWGNNVDNPYLTTFKTNQDLNSLWKIEAVSDETDCYYIIHYKTGKYLTSNETPSTNYDGGKNRRVVHLEKKSDAADADLYKFYIKSNTGAYQIYPKIYKPGGTLTDASLLSLNVKGDNWSMYVPQNGLATGIIGVYEYITKNKVNPGSQWFLEPATDASTRSATPIIKYSDSGENINISYPYSNETGITIYYTTDGTDPSTSETSSSYSDSNPISASGVVMVRAYAIKSGGVKSDEAVLWGSGRPFLIQSKENVNYYLVPSGNESNVNTSSIANAKMQWTLQSAGASADGMPYYYLVNSNGKIINYASTSSITLTTTSTDANKFCIIENGYGTGDFFLIPVSELSRCLFKKSNIDKANYTNGNTTSTPNITPETLQMSGRESSNGLDQWKLIVCNKDDDQKSLFTAPPFDVSDTGTNYYLISCAGVPSGYYIVPPSASSDYAMTSNTSDEYEEAPWMFKTAESDNWRTYYYIVNAKTGKYMYFNGNNNLTSALENAILMKAISESTTETEDKFRFIFVPSTTANAYYIVPKVYADNFSNNQYYGIWFYNEDNKVLETTWSRSNTANNVKWTFSKFSYCTPPVFTESEGNISISCNTTNSEIYITDDGTEPNINDNSQKYSTGNTLLASSQHRIKAKAVVYDNQTPISSRTVTLLNKPDITVEEVTYNGKAQEPGVTKVSIGEAGTETEAPSTAYSAFYGGDNINAGTTTATVTLTDADASDLWYIWNASTTFTIDRAPVTVKADNKEKEYGTPDPAWTATVTGMQNGESAAEKLSYTFSRTEGESIAGSPYTITPSGESAQGNYSVTFETGTLTITQKSVTVKADDKTKTYGDADPELTVTITGLLEGDPVSSISYNPPTRVAGENVDTYAISVSGESSLSSNYTVTFESGTLTINKKELTVTAKPNTITYGDAPTNDGVTYSTFAFEDNENNLSGELTYTYDYTQYDDVGSGSFTITPDGLTSSNYNITFVPGTLTVDQKEVEIEWSNTTLTYSGVEQGPAATVTNKVNNDDVVVTVTGKRTNAGTYNATAIASALTGTKAGNYKLPDPAPTSDFTINKARLMAVNLEKDAFTYNGGEQTITITSVTAGDGTNVTIPVVPTEDYDVSGISATNAGTYNVTVTPKSPSTNYETSVSVSKSFTIIAKSIGDGGEDPASGFAVDIDTSTNPYTVTVKQGETELTEGSTADYIVTTDVSNPKYTVVTVAGTGNYTGFVTSTYANVSFDSDGSTGAPYYGTFVADADHAKPAGMTPYIITNITGNTATAVALDYIPANVPVVLMNSEDASGFKVESGSGTVSTTGNLLNEVTADGGMPCTVAQIYVLYKGEFVLNKAGTLAKGKVYMNNPNAPGGSPARLKISKGDGTGIENIEYTIDPQSGAWYTLDGRRLSSKPTKKGLYLQSGKKIVVK